MSYGASIAIQHTFITTYGVKQNQNSDIVQSEVTAEGLFGIGKL